MRSDRGTPTPGSSRKSDAPMGEGSGRREFLKSVAIGGVLAGTTGSGAADAQEAVQNQAPKGTVLADPPKADPALQAAAERGTPTPATLLVEKPGSDFMIDVIKTLDIEYVAANPGSSFRGLHESLINHGGNSKPELLTCLHEETSVAMAIGYARAAGKPMAAFLHSTVGVQHAAMSIYHAFADRTAVLMFSGNTLDAADRRPPVEWLHSVQENAAVVRDCLKWDDQPGSLQHFAETAVRGYRLARSVPEGPVLIDTDARLQEEEVHGSPTIPRLTIPAAPVADRSVVAQIAGLLVNAESPLILADRYARTDAGMALLVKLAELVGAPVADLANRLNFPTRHPLNHTQRLRAAVSQADVILALEPIDLWGALNRLQDQAVKTTSRTATPDARVAVIEASSLLTRANYQDFQRYSEASIAATGDAEATMPSLLDEVERRLDPARRQAIAARRQSLGEVHATLFEREQAQARIGWDASPVSTGRLCSEVWDAIKDEDWVLAGSTFGVSYWPERLWDMDRPYRQVRGFGAGAIGAAIGVALGAALAHRAHGRLVVNIQPDGDLLYAPGALWTAAHHRIPLLTVMHNNRAYHQEIMHIQRMANRSERGIRNAHIGTTIDDPAVDFAKLAASFGVWSRGPISDPDKLAGTLREAIAVVKTGRPALIDVLTQGR